MSRKFLVSVPVVALHTVELSFESSDSADAVGALDGLFSFAALLLSLLRGLSLRASCRAHRGGALAITAASALQCLVAFQQ